jgi:hypothetical protein
VECEYAGPWIVYARFADATDLKTDVLGAPPRWATCVAGNEAIVDGLDPGQFAKACRNLGGVDIDGVAGLPEFSMGEDPNGARQVWRQLRGEERALRRYWSGGA